jgi:ankyrin repeat protein
MKNLKAAYDAIRNSDLDTLTGLLNSKPEIVRAMTPFGPLLHVAARDGREKMIDLLIERGADLEARGGTFGGTALNMAASSAQFDAARLLLRLGAEMDVSEPERNPLFGAIYSGSLEIVKLLVEHGVDITVAYTGNSMKNMDASAFALEREQGKIVQFLRNRLKDV